MSRGPASKNVCRANQTGVRLTEGPPSGYAFPRARQEQFPDDEAEALEELRKITAPEAGRKIDRLIQPLKLSRPE